MRSPFGAAGGQPRVGERVAELVWVDAPDAGGLAPAFEHLPQSGRREVSLAGQPQPLGLRQPVGLPHAQVPVEGDGGLVAEGAAPLPATLPQDHRHVADDVDVGQPQPD